MLHSVVTEKSYLHLVGYQRQFVRMAVVGEKFWEKWGTEASNLIFPGEIRFFEEEALTDALTWIRKWQPVSST